MLTTILSTTLLVMFIPFILVFCFMSVMLAAGIGMCLKIHSKIKREQKYMKEYNKKMHEAVNKEFSVKKVKKQVCATKEQL